jgi:hypothetical protein
LHLPAAVARDDVSALEARLFPLIGHLYRWHKTLDAAEKKEGPWVNLSVFSWKLVDSGNEEQKRFYNLFDCYLPSVADVQ